MQENTPFGVLEYAASIDRARIEPVLRALRWCETLLTCTRWVPQYNAEGVSLQRTINEHQIEIFPLEAAAMDLGYKTRFKKQHLPIDLNGVHLCVRSMNRHPRPLHTDMVASMMLLLGGERLEPAELPKTLHGILTPEQLASLPPSPPPRQRYVPGQPSTSGRTFVPEAEVLELLRLHPTSVFHIQFEKRDGTLRNMTAQCANWEAPNDDETGGDESEPRMRYDPSTYNLRFVVDMNIGQYRLVATDRVTELAIGERELRTASAE
ncbi:MAG: hypothetical protein ACPH8S_01530 [Poseidonia sp.]